MALKYNEPASGPIVATELISAQHYQFFKLISGTAGSVEPILGDSANGLDVDVTRIADGADVTLGKTTDTAIITDTNGTVIGFLRGLVKRSPDTTVRSGYINQMVYDAASRKMLEEILEQLSEMSRRMFEE